MMEAFSVSWRLRWWDDHGVRHDEHAVELVEASDAWHARDSIRRRTTARLEWPRRPFRLAFDDDRVDSTLNMANYPAGIPDRHVLRERVLAGTSPAALFAELIAGGAARLDILVGFVDAFDVPPEQAIDDLEAIDRQRHVWSRPLRIREAFDRGLSIVDTLHALYRDGTCANSLPLGMALRDALDLDFRDVKLLIELACHRDPTFDRELGAAMTRRRR
jgi:hypothetical protein